MRPIEPCSRRWICPSARCAPWVCYKPGRGSNRCRARGGPAMAVLVEPFQYAFFLHGLMAALLAGSLCGMLGVYIILRRMSYIGHGLSHAVFGGAVVSQMLGLNFYVGAGLWGFAA